jgi:hypothetical protein
MSINRTVGYSAPGQQYMLSIDGGTPIPLENLSITDSGRPHSESLLQPPREIQVEVTTVPGSVYSAQRPPSTTVGQVLNELDHLRAQVEQLRSWLSGVQPVEDPDMPGRFFCGVCQHLLSHHRPGCPAAP